MSIKLISLNKNLETQDYQSFVGIFPNTPFTKLSTSLLSLSTQEKNPDKVDIKQESIRR
jgi:hypothetical protein